MSIPKMQLGRTGVEISAMGFGAMAMSFYGPTVEEENLATIVRAIDLGLFIDTSDVYLGSEELLSKVLERRRKDAFICTKFGMTTDKDGPAVRGDPKYVREACEKSLARLKIDYIDLFYQHRVDPKIPIEETVEEMAKLVKEGKIRFLGLSECSAETLRRAHKIHPIAAVQVEYSLWCTDLEKNGLLEAARELGVTIIAYSPLGRGFLNGSVKSRNELTEKDTRLRNPRFSEENFPKNWELVKAIQAMAQKKNATPSQICLAWLFAQGNDVIPIPGTKRIEHLEENLKAIKVQLTKEEVDELRTLTDKVHGPRYNPAMMKFIQ